MTTTRIVVGIDDTPAGRAALGWATTYAATTGKKLRLVHVLELEPADIYGSTADLARDLRAEMEPRLTALATEVIGDSLPADAWRLDIVQGARGRRLVEAAEAADLLVIGTRDHVGLQRLLAGSVSHYCLAHSRTPVVAVPPPVHVSHKTLAEASASR